MTKTSFILDTDPWYDPDDLFAVRYLINSGVIPDLVVTGDEVGDKRAKLSKWFVQQHGLDDMKVIAGSELLGKTRLFCRDILPHANYNVSGNIVDEIAKVVDANDVTLYLGCTAMSNLAKFQKVYPELCDKIILYQMGGSLDLELEKAEHNVRIDIPAAQQVLESGIETYLVMLDTTLNPKYMISDEHPLYNFCKQNTNPGVRTIAQNIDEFHQELGFWTFMHDPLTISAVLGHDFVDFYKAKVNIDECGMITRSNDGFEIYLSKPKSKDSAFMEDFSEKIMMVDK